MTESLRLMETVVRGGYCIGCGACAVVEGSSFRISWNEFGQYEAATDPACQASAAEAGALAACPFSGAGADEEAIARERYAAHGTHHGRIGYHLATYAGYVVEGHFRRTGSSGGVASWLVNELFRRGLINAVIHVKPRAPQDTDSRLFRMAVSRSEREIQEGAKSRYYPVEMSHVLREVQQTAGRYAVVGLPCFIKAIRLLEKNDSRIRQRIAYCVGLVCGHLKSARFADMLAWQMGIPPGELGMIDFRRKITNVPASHYGIEATGCRGDHASCGVRRNQDLFGYNWGYGLLKYNACDYCDDVMAETADVSVGDAWLPQYTQDSGGTNVVVVRHPDLVPLMEEAKASGRLHLEHISADTVAQSQDAGLRHRREGLAYRLHLKDRAREWRPRKRIAASRTELTSRQRRIQKSRLELASLSHTAFKQSIAAGDFKVFQQFLAKPIGRYKQLYRHPLWRRLASRFWRFLRRRENAH